MSADMPGKQSKALEYRFGNGDPDVVADALAFLIHGQMWPIFSGDPGGRHYDLETPITTDALTRRIFENPN